jgi:hypothetical protein
MVARKGVRLAAILDAGVKRREFLALICGAAAWPLAAHALA